MNRDDQDVVVFALMVTFLVLMLALMIVLLVSALTVGVQA